MLRLAVIAVALVSLSGGAPSNAQTAAPVSAGSDRGGHDGTASKPAADFDYRAVFRVAPGALEQVRSPAMPSNVKDFERMGVWVNGAAAPVVEWHDCRADLLRRRVLISIDSCGRRVVIRAASTATHVKRVRVVLSTKSRNG